MRFARGRQDFTRRSPYRAARRDHVDKRHAVAHHWIAAAVFGCAVAGAAVAIGAHVDGAERYLYVWAGDQARSAPDFLAVVDFDSSSARYGRVIATRPLSGPGASGNEPHHVGLSRDGRVLALGGLLS